MSFAPIAMLFQRLFGAETCCCLPPNSDKLPGVSAQVRDRMRELDFNDDKSIQLHEFIYGFSAWVGCDEDGDEGTTCSAGRVGMLLKNQAES